VKVVGVSEVYFDCACCQEEEIQRLEASVMELENGCGAVMDDAVNAELERLLAENSKLKYQITHLRRVSDVAVQFLVSVAAVSNIKKETY